MTARTYLTGDDLIALSARIAAELDKITGRVPSIAEDFNRCLSTAGEAIGRPAWDFNASELDELADMVCDAIAGRSGDVPAPLPWIESVPTYSSACTRCRYSRPGATLTHRDHVLDERRNDEGCDPSGGARSQT